MRFLGHAFSLPLVLGLGGSVVGCGGSSSSDSGTVVNNVVLSPASGTVVKAGVQNQFYEQRFSVSSGGTSPYGFGEVSSGLPDGLFLVSVDSAGLAVSESTFADVVGFPRVAATSTMKFRVFDAKNQVTEPTYEVTISSVSSTALTLSPGTGTHLSNGTKGTAYGPVTLTIGNATVGNGAPGYTWRVAYGSLPTGLTLQVNPSGSNPAVAQIGGTPTGTGTWVFAIEVIDAGTSTTRGGGVYQITVQ